MLSSISIRIKIIIAQAFLVALVSVFIYTYYPNKQRDLAMTGIGEKVKGISNMFAIGVGIGMGEIDIVAVSEALSWANADSSVVYVSAMTTNGDELANYNIDSLKLPEEVHKLKGDSVIVLDKMLYVKNDIVYQGSSFGTLLIGYSLENMERELAKLKTTTLYFSLALFAVGLVFAIILGNVISGNIRKLANAVRMVSRGFENTRVRVMSKDETGKLATAFNEMLDRLDRSRHELILYSEQLKKQNEELNQFSYVVSHDLKAPLRAIFKLSEWIEEDLGSDLPDGTKKNLEMLRGRVFRLEALINGLLEYAKIGKVNVPSEQTDVQLLLQEVIDLLNPPPHIDIIIQDGLPIFNTKRVLLQQVFINLISNAIKYNDKSKGVIDISFKTSENFYRFTVSDNGMGIDPAYHEKVFSIFQTLEARDKVEGTGIGLSIIKKCIEDVGGTIKLESQAGVGAKFVFTWPKNSEKESSKQNNNNINKTV